MGAEIDKGQEETSRHHEATLAGLYEEYYNKIARYVLVHIGNRTEAEDLAGEVFLRALDSLKLYQERGILMQAWLFRIAHNLVVDHLRKRAKHKTVPIDTLRIESDMSPETIAEKILSWKGSPGLWSNLRRHNWRL